MHNRELNALQFQTITVRHHEHATPFYTVKYGPILGSATITNSAWSTKNSDLSITGKTATTTTTSAKFTASHPGTYTAVNTVTDSDGEIIQRKIILVYDTATFEPQYVYSGTPSTPTNLDLPWISIEEFGAIEGVGNAAVNDVAYADAAAWLALQTEAKAIVWPPGIWEISVCPNWAVDNAQLLAIGVVRWRYTGTGDAFILDGGATGAGVTNMDVGRFMVEGHDGSGDGIYIRAVHRSKFDFNVRGCGTTQAALRTEWCVLDEIRLTASGNEGGWYDDGSGEAEPLYGMYLDERASGEATSFCLFPNPILEGVGTGCYIASGGGNQFQCGAMEGCVTYGMNIRGGSTANRVIGTDFEVNGTADILCAGGGTDIISCDSDGEIIFAVDGGFSGSWSNLIGGLHDDITINAGVSAVRLANTSIAKSGGSGITDNGTNSVIRDVYDINTGTYHIAGARAAYNQPLTITQQTVTASPYTYTNTTDYPQSVLVTGGIISQILFIRGGVGHTTRAGIASGEFVGSSMFDLSPGVDAIEITYSSIPTVFVYTR